MSFSFFKRPATMLLLCMWIYINLFPALIVSYSEATSHCRNKCSTIAQGFGPEKERNYTILCSFARERCHNNQPHVISNVPKVVSKKWYLYENAVGRTHIALNISFRFSSDKTLKTTRGLHVSIWKDLPSERKSEDIYLCLNTSLEFYKHATAEYYYACYGTTNLTRVLPGDKLIIDLKAVPNVKPLAPITQGVSFRVPDCAHKDLSSVYECVLMKQMQAKILAVDCYNNSISYKYDIPKNLGSVISLKVCQGKSEDVLTCHRLVQIWNARDFTATEWYTLPSNFYDEHLTYTLIVSMFGAETYGIENTFTFRHCSDERAHRARLRIVIISVTSLTAVLFLALMVVCLRKRYFCILSNRFNLKFLSFGDKSLASLNLYSTNESENLTKEPVSVFVVFVDDHPKHREVVIKFVTYLQQDLGFNVKFELWEQLAISEDYTFWVEKTLKEVDKVIVVWSPGATKRWNNAECPDASSDTFNHVIKQIHRDQFQNLNQGRYFFAYLEYCGREGKPVEEILSRTVCSFCLMRQFNKLYFHLVSQEENEPGGVAIVKKVNEDTYYNPSINEIGPYLKEAIDDMILFVKRFPNWSEIGDSYNCEVNDVYSARLLSVNSKVAQQNQLQIVPPEEFSSCEDEMQHLVSPNPLPSSCFTKCDQEHTDTNSDNLPFASSSGNLNDLGTVGQASIDQPADHGRQEDVISATDSNSFRLPFPERPHSPVHLMEIDFVNDPIEVIHEINKNKM